MSLRDINNSDMDAEVHFILGGRQGTGGKEEKMRGGRGENIRMMSSVDGKRPLACPSTSPF